MHTDRSNEGRNPPHLFLILSLALCLRLVFVFHPPQVPLFADMRDYHIHAGDILEKGTLGPPVRPPLYPLFLATVYALSGYSQIAVRAAQAILGVLVCLPTRGIAVKLAGRRAAAIACAIVACYPSLVIYTSLLMSENLFIPLLAAALWLLVRRGKRRDSECACAGLLIGLGALTRSVLAGFPPLVAVWLWAGGERRRALLFLVGSLVVIAPWAARSSRYHGRFVLIDTFSGYNFFVGNNPNATGRQYLPLAEPAAPEAGMPRKDNAEISAEGYWEGMKFIAGNPLRFLELGVRKTGYFLAPEGRELFWGYSKNCFGEVTRAALIPAAIALIAAFPLLCFAAISGLLLRRDPSGRMNREWTPLVLVAAYFIAAHFLTFGESRFHLPLVPVLAIFAGRLAWRPAEGAREALGRARLLVFAVLVWLLLLNTFGRLSEDWERISAILGPGGNITDIEY